MTFGILIYQKTINIIIISFFKFLYAFSEEDKKTYVSWREVLRDNRGVPLSMILGNSSEEWTFGNNLDYCHFQWPIIAIMQHITHRGKRVKQNIFNEKFIKNTLKMSNILGTWF